MNSQVPVVHVKRTPEKQTNKYSSGVYVMSLVPLIASSRCHQWPVKKGRDVFKTTQTLSVTCKNKILLFASTFQQTKPYIHIYGDLSVKYINFFYGYCDSQCNVR